ncbi:hypothetical protein [Ensifer sp. 4252]
MLLLLGYRFWEEAGGSDATVSDHAFGPQLLLALPLPPGARD